MVSFGQPLLHRDLVSKNEQTKTTAAAKATTNYYGLTEGKCWASVLLRSHNPSRQRLTLWTVEQAAWVGLCHGPFSRCIHSDLLPHLQSGSKSVIQTSWGRVSEASADPMGRGWFWCTWSGAGAREWPRAEDGVLLLGPLKHHPEPYRLMFLTMFLPRAVHIATNSEEGH